MDEKIYQMIAEYIQLSKIVIECQSKKREDPYTFLIGIFDQPFQTIPREGFDLDIGVLGDIGLVIELEWNMESIGVG